MSAHSAQSGLSAQCDIEKQYIFCCCNYECIGKDFMFPGLELGNQFSTSVYQAIGFRSPYQGMQATGLGQQGEGGRGRTGEH